MSPVTQPGLYCIVAGGAVYQGGQHAGVSWEHAQVGLQSHVQLLGGLASLQAELPQPLARPRHHRGRAGPHPQASPHLAEPLHHVNTAISKQSLCVKIENLVLFWTCPHVHMSTSMQLNLFVVWSLEFSIVNSQVNSYIVVHIWQVSMKLFLVFRIIFCYFYTKCIIIET